VTDLGVCVWPWAGNGEIVPTAARTASAKDLMLSSEVVSNMIREEEREVLN
jgi:hypothetical protein